MRYTSPEIGHYQPIWFFIPCLILGFFPWSAFLLQAITKTVKEIFYEPGKAGKEIYLFLWAALIFTFFTFSKSKLIPYILPIFPPLALLTAHYLRQAIKTNKKIGPSSGFIFLFMLSVTIFIIFKNFAQTTLLPNIGEAKLLLCSSAAILTLGSLLSLIYGFLNLKRAINLMIVTIWLFLIIVISAAPAIDSRSIYPLAQHLKMVAKNNEEVITFNRYYQDLPFYLGRKVSILNWRNELSYGMQHQDTPDWLIDDAIFWQRFHGPKRIFVIVDLDEYNKLKQLYPQEKFYFLKSTVNTTLISNQAGS